MSKVIVYSQNNGQCAVCHPNLDCGLTIEEIAEKDCPKPYWIIDESELPASPDDPLFNAWEVSNGKPAVHLDKAKNVAHEHRRRVRDAEFEPLDRQASNPALYDEVEIQRQAIRDAHAIHQANIDAAVDATEIRNIMAEI